MPLNIIGSAVQVFPEENLDTIKVRYLTELERQLESWVAKTQTAFQMGFCAARKYPHLCDWRLAFDEAIKDQK